MRARVDVGFCSFYVMERGKATRGSSFLEIMTYHARFIGITLHSPVCGISMGDVTLRIETIESAV